MQKIVLTFFAILALFQSAQAQKLVFGVIGGTGITSDFPTTDTSNPAAFGNPASRFQFVTGPKSFLFGALLELHLLETLSIETNILRRPLKSTIIYATFPTVGPSVVTNYTSTNATTWDFPVMLKYTLPAGLGTERLRPFVEAGSSFRTNQNASAVQPSQYGFTAGAGLAFNIHHIRISPTFRYTRWAAESISPRYVTKRDQLEVLTSIAYETDAGSRHVGIVGSTLESRLDCLYRLVFPRPAREPSPESNSVMSQASRFK